jgi:FMN phosphatase YigB (HAD superfamily)
VDLGNVLIDFNGKHIFELIKKSRMKEFIACDIIEHDKNLISLWSLFHRMKFDKYFNREVLWEEFILAYHKGIVGIHEPMYDALEKLKKAGVKLVSITDNNHFALYQITLKCQQIFLLFRENGKDQIVLSNELHAIKREGNPFVHASSMFGFSNKDACFVDDHEYNFPPAVANGFDQDACFLYKIKNKRNHAQFKKFLEKHFFV